jgi:vacuolar protein sorting-associated protein 35
VQLYVDALDRYIYYFEQGVEAVTPKYVNSLVELITSNIDSIYGNEGLGGGNGNAPGLVDGVNSPEMIVKVSLGVRGPGSMKGSSTDIQHFRNTLTYIHTRQRQSAEKASNGNGNGNGIGGSGASGEDDDEGGGAVEKAHEPDWDSVDIVGGSLKMGIGR